MEDGTCRVPGCPKPARARRANRLCVMHDARLRLHGSTEIPPRINPCKGCGTPVQRSSVTGKDPVRCPPCQREHRNELKRQRRQAEAGVALQALAPLTCITCKAEFRRKSLVGVAPIFCPPCGSEQKRLVDRLWVENNRDRARATARRISHRRRARKRSAESERFDDIEVFERDGWRCQICRRRVRRNVEWPHPLFPTLDHVVPLSDGGPHTRANSRLACWKCNNKRNRRGGDEQLALIG